MKISSIIPHNKPFFDQNDRKALTLPLDSSWVARGQTCAELEKEFDFYLLNKRNTANHSLCVSSGTAALYLALTTLHSQQQNNISKNSVKSISDEQNEVILPTYTCSAVINAIRLAGLKPILCDIDPVTLNPSPDKYLNRITNNTVGIIITHSHGFPANTKSIQECIQKKLKKKIFIIEDCCQSLGSQINSNPCGSFGDASIFSFHATKIITGGQGGLVFFKNPDNRKKALNFIDYDMPDNSNLHFNFLLSDINASLALSQFKKLQNFITQRNIICNAYRKKILDLAKDSQILHICHPKGLFPKGLLPKVDDSETDISKSFSNNYRFILFLTPKYVQPFIKGMYKQGISTINPFKKSELLHHIYGIKGHNFAGAEEAVFKTVSIPIYPALIDDQVNHILQSIEKVLKELSKETI